MVKGKVQGVYFRASTVEQAARLDLKGHVENLSDGNVGIVAEGRAEDIEELVKWCRRGPRCAKVESVDIDWMLAEGEFADFRIRKSLEE